MLLSLLFTTSTHIHTTIQTSPASINQPTSHSRLFSPLISSLSFARDISLCVSVCVRVIWLCVLFAMATETSIEPRLSTTHTFLRLLLSIHVPITLTCSRSHSTHTHPIHHSSRTLSHATLLHGSLPVVVAVAVVALFSLSRVSESHQPINQSTTTAHSHMLCALLPNTTTGSLASVLLNTRRGSQIVLPAFSSTLCFAFFFLGGERFASGHPCSAAPSHIAVTGSATCVQNLDDSLGSAIRTTYRISLRSSSVQEPRHPLHRVVFLSLLCVCVTQSTCLCSLSHCVSLLSLNPPLLSLLLQSLE